MQLCNLLLVIVYFGAMIHFVLIPMAKMPIVPLPEYVENMRKIAIHLKSLFGEDTGNISSALLRSTRHKFWIAMVVVISTTTLPAPLLLLEAATITGQMSYAHKYSEACIELCHEFLDVKVVDLWTALQQREELE
nr:GDSL esterase/lipase CPRD49-like [Ipomoea batatas]